MVLIPAFTDRTQPVRVSRYPRQARSEGTDLWLAVTRLEMTTRELLLNGKLFGAQVIPKCCVALSPLRRFPAQSAQYGIPLISIKRRRTAAGPVAWWADLPLLQPADPARENRGLLFGGGEPGRYPGFRMFDSVPEDAQ